MDDPVDLARLTEEQADTLLGAIRGQQRAYSDLLCIPELPIPAVDDIRHSMLVLALLDKAVLERSWEAARESVSTGRTGSTPSGGRGGDGG